MSSVGKMLNPFVFTGECLAHFTKFVPGVHILMNFFDDLILARDNLMRLLRFIIICSIELRLLLFEEPLLIDNIDVDLLLSRMHHLLPTFRFFSFLLLLLLLNLLLRLEVDYKFTL